MGSAARADRSWKYEVCAFRASRPLWGAAVVSSVDNFLRPRLVAGRVGLSGLAMFVAMLGGLQAFGALGIVLGPVTFAAAAAIVDVLRETEG
jgi:predicted PurR-regulated permease PerM